EGNLDYTAARFTVSLSSPPVDDISVDFVTRSGDNARRDLDYESQSGTVYFSKLQPWALSKEIVVNVIADTINEYDATFYVDLMNPVNATIAKGTGVGTIVNDDPLPSFQISDVVYVDAPVSGSTFAVLTLML